MRIEEGAYTADVGVVSSADHLQIEAITVRALDNYFVLFSEFWPQTTNGFTLPGESRLCDTTHKSFDRSSRKSTKDCLCQLDEIVGLIFAGVVAAAWLTPT
jgi:hypothetical protein